MTTTKFIVRIALLAPLALVAVHGPNQAAAQDGRSYILATATTGGTYYPVGVALATLVKVKLQDKHKIDMSAISSGGSNENIKLMREKQAQFAILQGLFGLYARDGTGPIADSGPQKNLRAIAMLWTNVEHFLVLAQHAKTGTVDDLKGIFGKKFSIGARGSGTEHSNRFLLKNLGIDVEKFDLVYQGYGPSIAGMQNGTIDGTNPTAGVPVSTVTQAFAQMGDKVRLLEFTDEQAKRADGGTGLYYPVVIPPNTYPGQTKPLKTAGQPNFLGVNADVPEGDVYLVTKTIFENLAFLNNIHAGTKEMGLDSAVSGLPAPLHAGAAKYFKEAGVKVPASLLQ